MLHGPGQVQVERRDREWGILELETVRFNSKAEQGKAAWMGVPQLCWGAWLGSVSICGVFSLVGKAKCTRFQGTYKPPPHSCVWSGGCCFCSAFYPWERQRALPPTIHSSQQPGLGQGPSRCPMRVTRTHTPAMTCLLLGCKQATGIRSQDANPGSAAKEGNLQQTPALRM